MYYKVVNKDMSSAYVGSNFVYDSEKIKVYYKINKWVQPKIKGSKLMVFDSLEKAENFIKKYGWGNYIYKCEVKNPSKNGIFIKGNFSLAKNILKLFKLKNNKKKFTHLLHDPIEGTIFCDAVKLIEKL